MDCGKLTNTVLVIDDMDLLVLLCYHADKHLKVIYILPIMQYCLLTNISIIGFLDPESIWLETIIVLIGQFFIKL